MMRILKGRFCVAAFIVTLSTMWQTAASATVIHTDQFFLNGHTYHLLAASSWNLAEQEAVSLGGHLVTINSVLENAFVYNTFKQFALNASPATGKVNLWLGYNDAAVEGTFVWVSGQTPTYTDWFDDQPQKEFNDEDYAGIRVRGSDGSVPVGHWIDIVANLRLDDLSYGVVEVEGLGPGAPEPSAFVLAILGGTIGIGGRFLRRRQRVG
jgi:hypothetical protein